MTYAPNQPRMFADYAALPTPTERAGARRYWRNAQASLTFEHEPEHDAAPCPVCASTDHTAERCPHGAAPTLTLAD